MASRLSKIEAYWLNDKEIALCDVPTALFGEDLVDTWGATCNYTAWEKMYQCTTCPLDSLDRYYDLWSRLCPDWRPY